MIRSQVEDLLDAARLLSTAVFMIIDPVASEGVNGLLLEQVL